MNEDLFHRQAMSSRRIKCGEINIILKILKKMVGMAGFEPTTP